MAALKKKHPKQVSAYGTKSWVNSGTYAGNSLGGSFKLRNMQPAIHNSLEERAVESERLMESLWLLLSWRLLGTTAL